MKKKKSEKIIIDEISVEGDALGTAEENISLSDEELNQLEQLLGKVHSKSGV